MTEERDQERPALLHLLEPDEELHIETRAVDRVLALTDRRIVVAEDERVVLDVSYDGLRRVQFDVERGRAATLVLVPEQPRYEPQVLMIAPEEYARACQAIVIIGERIA